MVSKTKLLKSNEYHTGPGYNSCPGQRPRFHIWNFQWIPVSNHGGIIFILSNQNIIIQRMSNQDLKDKQFLCNLFSWTTSQKLSQLQNDQSRYSKRWTTSLLLILLSNQFGTYIYCEQPEHCLSEDEQPLCLLFFVSNLLFFISSSLANEMCQRGPGDAGRILPTVLSYLIRYYLT